MDATCVVGGELSLAACFSDVAVHEPFCKCSIRCCTCESALYSVGLDTSSIVCDNAGSTDTSVSVQSKNVIFRGDMMRDTTY